MIRPQLKTACRIVCGGLLISLAGLLCSGPALVEISPPVAAAAPTTTAIVGPPPSQRTAPRHYLWENGIKVELRQVTNPNATALISFPFISGLKDPVVAKSLNQQLEKLCRNYGEGKSLNNKAAVRPNGFGVNYTVTTNYNNVLGLSLRRWLPSDNTYQDPEPQGALLFELQTGRRLGLSDIFSSKTDYRSLINNEISRQIFARQLDERAMQRPFTGIDPQPIFYLQPKALVILFSPGNFFFQSYDYTYYDYYEGDNYQFTIPFHRLSGVVIYDRFGSPSPSLYGRTKLQKYMLPNELVLKLQVRESGTGENYKQVEYLTVSDYPDQLVEAKINRVLEAEADRALAKHSYLSMREMANFGGYLSLEVNEYNPQGSNLRHGLCFDLKTGNPARLSGLFKSWADAKQVIGRAIVNAYGSKDYQGFDALAAQTSFSFDDSELKLYFQPGLPLLKGRSDRTLTIPFERFGGREQLQVFD